MKKDIVIHLRQIADNMPLVYETVDDQVLWQGHDLLLTPLAHQVDDPEAWYAVYCPKFVAVQHYQQLKDAYKRSGWPGVMDYNKKVLRLLNFSEAEIEELIQTKKEEIYN